MEMQKYMIDLNNKRGAKYDNEKIPIDVAMSDHFNLYTYPQEVSKIKFSLLENCMKK